MNCRSAELFMTALLDDELPIKDSLEIVDHIESCKSCKEKWELNEETRAKLKHFITSISATSEFRKKILNGLGNKSSVIQLKPLLLAASIAFLLGLGILIGPTYSKMPSLSELHSKTNLQILTNDTKSISNHLGINIPEQRFWAFKEADFKIEGATKLQRPFNKKITLISFKNKEGNKISLCFLPQNYDLSMCHKMEMNGVTFHCGQSNNCRFTYWKQNDQTVALVSDTFSGEEMIYLAIPFIKES